MKLEQMQSEAYGRLGAPGRTVAARSRSAAGQDAAEQKIIAEEAGRERPVAGFAKIAEPMEKLMESLGVELKFNIHEDTGEIQAEVRGGDGKKVIRKVPPDAQLDLAASIKKLSSLFLNRTL